MDSFGPKNSNFRAFLKNFGLIWAKKFKGSTAKVQTTSKIALKLLKMANFLANPSLVWPTLMRILQESPRIGQKSTRINRNWTCLQMSIHPWIERSKPGNNRKSNFLANPSFEAIFQNNLPWWLVYKCPFIHESNDLSLETSCNY